MLEAGAVTDPRVLNARHTLATSLADHEWQRWEQHMGTGRPAYGSASSQLGKDTLLTIAILWFDVGILHIQCRVGASLYRFNVGIRLHYTH
jgi:hypothetical protein